MSHSVPTDSTWATYLMSEPRLRTLTCVDARQSAPGCVPGQPARRPHHLRVVVHTVRVGEDALAGDDEAA